MLGKLTKLHFGDLTVGARSWRPLVPDPLTSGGIFADKGRFISPSQVHPTSTRQPDPAKPPRVNLVTPADVQDPVSGLGEDFEREAKAFELAQTRHQVAKEKAVRAELAAAEARSASEENVDVARDVAEQQRRYETLAAAQKELEARDHDLQEKERRLNQLMQEEEARATLEILRQTALAEREEEESKNRLELIELEAQHKRKELKALWKEEEAERENAMNDDKGRDRLRIEEEQSEACERHIADTKSEAEARRLAHRAEIFARQQAILDRHQQRQTLLAHITAPERTPIRSIEPIKFAHAYHTPSAASFIVPSPRMPMSPLFIPDDVRRAGKAGSLERELTLQETADEMRRVIDEIGQRTRRLAIERDRDAAALKERDDAEKRRRSADLEEIMLDMRMKEEKARKADAELARIAAEEEQLLRQKERAQAAATKAQVMENDSIRPSVEKNAPHTGFSVDDDAARKRGAEAAAYYMAKQSLTRKARQRSATGVPSSIILSNRLSDKNCGDMTSDSKAQRLRLTMKRRASDGHLPPLAASVPARTIDYTYTPRLHEAATLMTPHPGHDISTTASRSSSPPPRQKDNFIVVSGDKIGGYSHDVLELVQASALRDVGRTPALAYISGAGAGRDENKQGKMAAVNALVNVAEKMGADAIISLRLQPPKPVDETKVEYIAYGLAVTLKFSSPEPPARRTSNSSQDESMFDDIPSVCQVASAPPLGLTTPSDAGSSPFSSPNQATPKAIPDGETTPKGKPSTPPLPSLPNRNGHDASPSYSANPVTNPRLEKVKILHASSFGAKCSSIGSAAGARSRSMPPQHGNEFTAVLKHEDEKRVLDFLGIRKRGCKRFGMVKNGKNIVQI